MLASLVDKSLLRETADRRFFMLDTISEYARERLGQSDELHAMRDGHAHSFLALVERAGAELRGDAQGRWLARLQQEHANLLAALAWLRDSGDEAHLLRMATTLFDFWASRDPREGRRWLAAALVSGHAGLGGSQVEGALQGLVISPSSRVTMKRHACWARNASPSQKRRET